MICISHLKVNYFAVINYPQIFVADNNSSLILLMVHVYHRLAWLCSTGPHSSAQTHGAAPTWDITGLMAESYEGP